jgi:hypothetical protein
MKYEDLIGIETPIKYKFQNKMLPELVEIIRDYLFKNPHKLAIYLSEDITVGNLLRYLVTIDELKNNYDLSTGDILKEIIKFVEGSND